MIKNHPIQDSQPVALAKRIIAKEYGRFCVEQKTDPSTLAAERFALKVTESGSKDFHGMNSQRLVQILSEDNAARSHS